MAIAPSSRPTLDRRQRPLPCGRRARRACHGACGATRRASAPPRPPPRSLAQHRTRRAASKVPAGKTAIAAPRADERRAFTPAADTRRDRRGVASRGPAVPFEAAGQPGRAPLLRRWRKAQLSNAPGLITPRAASSLPPTAPPTIGAPAAAAVAATGRARPFASARLRPSPRGALRFPRVCGPSGRAWCPARCGRTSTLRPRAAPVPR